MRACPATAALRSSADYRIMVLLSIGPRCPLSQSNLELKPARFPKLKRPHVHAIVRSLELAFTNPFQGIDHDPLRRRLYPDYHPEWLCGALDVDVPRYVYTCMATIQ
jgi:hypothetical protein